MTKHQNKFEPKVAEELTKREFLKPKYDRSGRPNLSGAAPTHSVYSARVDTALKEEVEQWARESGWTMRQITEFALRTVTKQLTPEIARKMMLDLH